MGCGSSAGQVVEQNKAPGFKGPIFITIKNALLDRDVRFLGTMDPYIKLILPAKKETQTFKTPVHKEGGMHPKWDGISATFQKLLGEPDIIIGQVWCENTITSDILIGEGAFSLTSIRKGNAEPRRISFLLFHNGEKAGEVNLEVTFTLDPSGKDLAEIKAPDTEGKFIVKPKFGRLKRDVNLALKMDPFCTIRFGNETMKTAVSSGAGITPKWSDELIYTRETNEDTLYIEVWHESLIGWDDFIGCGYCSITDALTLKENIQQLVRLYYNGEDVGEIELEYTFKTSQPQSYFVQGEQGPLIPEKGQMQNYPQQLTNFANHMDQRYGSSFGQNQSNGRIEFTYPNGDFYSGEIVGNVRQGQGKLTYSYGGYYEGQWQNDQQNGQGTLVVGDTRYEGQFTNGKKNGVGKQFWNNGQAFDGQWIDNNMHGNGEWVFPNGGKKKGVWANGNRIRWLDDDQNVMQAGKTMTSGFLLNSPSGQFSMNFMHDGRLYVFHNASRQPVFGTTNFNRFIQAPFWLRFDVSGELQLIDASGRPYWVTGQGQGVFAAPFTLAVQDDGKIVIKDANGLPKWYSH